MPKLSPSAQSGKIDIDKFSYVARRCRMSQDRDSLKPVYFLVCGSIHNAPGLRTSFLFSDGIARKSKVSRLLVVGNFAALIRRL